MEENKLKSISGKKAQEFVALCSQNGIKDVPEEALARCMLHLSESVRNKTLDDVADFLRLSVHSEQYIESMKEIVRRKQN